MALPHVLIGVTTIEFFQGDGLGGGWMAFQLLEGAERLVLGSFALALA